MVAIQIVYAVLSYKYKQVSFKSHTDANHSVTLKHSSVTHNDLFWHIISTAYFYQNTKPEAEKKIV